MGPWGCLTHSFTSLQRQETSRNFLRLFLEQGFISGQYLKFRWLDTTGLPRPQWAQFEPSGGRVCGLFLEGGLLC